VPFVELTVESEALRGNPLGDPHVRQLQAYVPPGDGRRPAVYVLHAFTSQLRSWFNVSPFAPTFPERIEALAPDCVVVLVDAWTALGGSQFVDSPAVGNYHTYLCEDVVGLVDRELPTLAAREHRGLLGHSSGGYGAALTAMLRPDLFGGFASHAGDALFEVCFAPEFPKAARALRDRYDGSWERFWEDFRSGRPAFSRSGDHDLLMTYAMAACYSANADGSIDFPFDLETGAIVPDVWERWLAFDPVRLAARSGDALRSLRAIWIDAGRGDEFFLDLGATALHRAIAEAGVADDVVRFELFDGRHGGVSWRYPLSLAFLAERLA